MDAVFKIEPLESFLMISEKILTRLYLEENDPLSKLSIEPHVIEAAKQDLKNIIASSNFQMNKVTELLVNKNWNQDKVKGFLTLLEKRKTELLYAALNNYSSAHGETISDIHWVIKLVLGSSELKTLQYPLLQLMFQTINFRGEQRKIIYELNKDLLQKAISALEDAT